MGASRLHQMSHILQVPVAFFFEGAPRAFVAGPERAGEIAESPAYVSQFLATPEGLALVRAFTRIRSPKVRRSIVMLVRQITAEEA